jgi:hypothetical protein
VDINTYAWEDGRKREEFGTQFSNHPMNTPRGPQRGINRREQRPGGTQFRNLYTVVHFHSCSPRRRLTTDKFMRRIRRQSKSARETSASPALCPTQCGIKALTKCTLAFVTTCAFVTFHFSLYLNEVMSSCLLSLVK